jgi:two-component system, chemotaxis family, chemotaxis protein CheY
MKILIIDDSKAMRTFLDYLVRGLGIECDQAEDGCAALEVLNTRGGFDVALVDWDMPRMNGLEFVQAVRADPAHAGLKLMMVTTQNSMDRVAAALQAGADDFLMKPVTKESLEDKLRVIGVLV